MQPRRGFCFGKRVNQASGRTASASSSSPANSPARKCGYAAAAIIAALSVESARLGKNDARPRRAASSSNVLRSSALAATPPETSTVAARSSSAASNVGRTKSRTTLN